LLLALFSVTALADDLPGAVRSRYRNAPANVPVTNATISPAEVDTITLKADAGYVDSFNARVATAITELADAGFFGNVHAGPGSVVGAMNFNAFNQMTANGDVLELSAHSVILQSDGAQLSGNGSTGAWAFNGNLAANSRDVTVAAPIDGGAAFTYIEYGNVTCSSGRCPITFRNAFAFSPRCNCTAITDAGCNLEAAATTSAVAFHSCASCVVDWNCIGDR
jgi:hypothetical protein